MATVIGSAAQWNALAGTLSAGIYQLGEDITFDDSGVCTTKIIGPSTVFDGKGRSVYLDMTSNNFPPFDLRGGTLLNVTVRGGNSGTPRAVTLPTNYGGVVACGTTSTNTYKGVVRNCHSRNVSSGSGGGGIVGPHFGGSTSAIEFCSTDNQPAASVTGGIAGPYLVVTTTVRDCLFLGDMASASYQSGQLTPFVNGDGTMTILRCYFGGAIPPGNDCGMIGAHISGRQTVNIDECIFAGTNHRGSLWDYQGAIYGDMSSSALTVNITNSYILTVQSGSGASAISAHIAYGAIINLDSVYITGANNYAISQESYGTITAINGVYTNATASLFGTGSVSSGTITQSLAAAYATSLPASWDANVWTPASDGTSDTFHTLKAFENTTVYANYTAYDSVPAFATTLTNNSAGFAVSATALTVSESGSTATFDVVLLAEPDDTVVLTVTSADTGEVTVSPSPLTFTTANWYTPQTVTVTGANDSIADGNIAVTVTVAVDTGASTGTAYDAVSARTVTVTNTDNDVARLIVTETALTVSESGTTAPFYVCLDAQPLDTVTLSVTSANTDEVTVSPPTLTFTTDNYNTLQTVTVTGVDDALVDGSIDTLVTISISAGDGGAYDAVSSRTVTVTNTSNDVPVIATSTSSVSGMIGEAVSVTIVNSGGSGATFTVSPSLPAGLSINSSTGTISGTPTAETASATYTIIATNTDGADIATVTIVVIVNAPSITPSVSVAAPVALTAGVAMTPITISNSGGASTTYSVTPALPAGLSLNTTTGTISGTPLGTRSTTITTHTVTATNDGGSSSFVISFAITSTTVCFVDPTTAMVRLTDGGTRSVDALQPGDRVAVLGVGAAPARVVGVHRTQHAGRVIMIGANMLGYRHNELRLTEGHLVAQWLANRRIRLMPAGALPTSQQTRTTTVAHVSLDRNDLLCVNGVWVESADTTGAAATARIAKLYATLAQRNVACHHR